MSCNALIDPACLVLGNGAGSVTSSLASGLLTAIAQAIQAALRWIVENTATWWVRLPSPSLAGEPAVTHIQQWLLPVTAAVALGGVIAAGARMALTRRANPLLDVTAGLLTLATATVLGTIVPALLLKAGDAWANWILQVSTGGQFTQRLDLLLGLGGSTTPAALVLILGTLAIILSLIQAALMLFRQIALVILAGVLPLAAAGSIAPMTRNWMRKVTAWMLALIFYKPAAAAVYATAFTLFGTGKDPLIALMGFVILAMSVVMLPALMKFFTWTTGSIDNSGGGGGQILGAAAMGAVAIGAMRSGGGGAQDQASYLNSQLDSAPGGALPPGGGSSAPPPAGPAGGSGGGGVSGGGPSGGGAAAGPSAGPTAGPAGAAPASTRPPFSTGPLPTGAASGSSTGAAGTSAGAGGGSAAASGSSAASASGAGTAAAGAASPAGPMLAAAVEAAKLADRAAHTATGAMEAGDQ